MSASREKRMRKNTEVKAAPQQAPAKAAMPKAVKWIIAVVVILVALALAGVSLLFGSTYFHTNTVALTVGEHEISPAEFNYFYREAYYNMSQESPESSSYLSYMTDLIVEEAKNNAVQTYALYDAAIAEGYTLTEEEIAELDTEMEDMKSTAKAMGASNASQMLASVYGKGSNEKSYRAYREMYTIVARYTQDKTEEQDTSAEALAAYYAEHADELDTVTYRQFFLPLQGTMEETKALAETILEEAKADETVMDKYALEYASEDNKEHYETTENATLLKGVDKASANAEVADWLFEAARLDGDTASFENEEADGLYLVRFTARDDNDYNTVNVRHILISTQEATDEEAKKAAQEKAQATLDEFRNGDKTEESFAALAEEYSEDNADEGGLYENIFKGQMVTAFEDWCFDPARKSGDSGIVETEYGYHVMYFVSEGENLRDTMVETTILNNFFTEWTDELTAGYETATNDFAMGFVTTTVENYDNY